MASDSARAWPLPDGVSDSTNSNESSGPAMTVADFIGRQLGPCDKLISPADREWLIREMSSIEAVSRKLAEVEKGPLDFSTMCPLSPASPTD